MGSTIEFDVLKTLSTYDKSTSKILYWCLYHKGKKSYERTFKYEDDMLRLVLYYKKGKLQGKSEYKYNKNGFLTELTHYNKKKKLIDIIRLSYEI